MFRRVAILFIGGGLLISLAACRSGAPAAPTFTRNPYIAYCANTGNVACINQIVQQLWAPGEWGLVECIIVHESGYDIFAHNPSGASGLMQLELPIHNDMFYAAGYNPGQWADAYANLSAARELQLSSGWGPWHPDCGI